MSPVRVIDEQGNNLGTLETSKALSMAKERELDLVEVAPKEHPPVCKIISWSKFRYDLSKKKKATIKRKSIELKEMRFSPFTDEGDKAHKLKRVTEFLSKKHPVKLTVRVKGRVHKEMVTSQLDSILEQLKGKYETDQTPVFQGRNLTITVFPTK